MISTPIKIATTVCVAFGAACVSQSAEAGTWKFHPERCPDLVEDRRDRIESRRDERVTVCPRSAWTYVGKGRFDVHPAALLVYYDPYKHYYYQKKANGARVKIVIR